MKTLIKIILVIALLVGGAIYLLPQLKTNPIAPQAENEVKKMEIVSSPLFTDGLEAMGVKLDELGFHSFSPDGKYFVFTGIKDSDEIPAKTYLYNLETGEVKKLPGILLRGFEDSRLLALFEGTDLVLYDVEKGTTENIVTDGNIYGGGLSPDGAMYVFNTVEGIRKYDRNNKTLETISGSQYDGATAWFKDSSRMIGFKDTGVKVFDAGNNRELGIWNLKDKSFAPIAVNSIPKDTIRNATWIVEEKIARVNTGWDDSSHDYLLNIQTGEAVDLGDTSSALMAGMKDDESLGLFAIVEGYGDLGNEINATVYKGMEKVSSHILPTGYIRENVHIVDQNSLIYIRKHLGANQVIDAAALVQLDMKTGEEKVIKELTLNVYNSLSLAPDYNTWVVSAKNQFFAGKLK